MNADDLLNAIGEIDDSLVQRARMPKNTKKVWYTCTAAACAAVVTIVSLQWLPLGTVPDPGPVLPTEQTSPQPPTEYVPTTEPPAETPTEARPRPGEITLDPELPTLQVKMLLGQGFESLDTCDITQENPGNPWSADAQIDVLPVYKNLAYTNSAGEPFYLTEGEMDQLAQAAADTMGETAVQRQDTDGEQSKLDYLTPTMEIKVYGDGTVSLSFLDCPVIPAEYRLKEDSTQQDAEKTAEYLLETYHALLALAGVTEITGVEYRDGQLTFCERGADLPQSIRNYSGFAGVSFTISPDGQIEQVRLDRQNVVAEMIGEYPVISAEEAETMLLEGAYLSSVWEMDLAGGAVSVEIIGKEELVYRIGSAEETFLPYYRFYLEMSGKGMTWLQEGEKCYGVFYVPAVHPAYLEGLPLWDSHLN